MASPVLQQWRTAGRKYFKHNLRTNNPLQTVEAYNWVVSICLKYVSLPWNMVNSLRRGASEPWAWREFYKTWLCLVCKCPWCVISMNGLIAKVTHLYVTLSQWRASSWIIFILVSSTNATLFNWMTGFEHRADLFSKEPRFER